MSRDRFDCMRGWLVGVLPSAYREGAMPWVFFIGIAVGVLMLGLAVVEYQTFGDLASLLFAVSIFVLLFAVQRGLSFRRAVQWAMGAGLCAQWLASWSSGGIYSPRLAWLVLLPLTPFFFFGLRAGVRWLSVVAFTLLGLALSTQFGWLAVPATSDAVSMASAWASFALVTVFMLVVPISYHRMNERALAEQKQRRDDLERKRAELERTQALRDRFIASVSHELRTPMNAILGLNEWLISRVSADSEAMTVLRHTRESADHLMTVIDDVLDYSQLQSGTLQLHPEVVDLKGCVRSAFDMLAPKASAQGLVYRCHIDPSVPAWATVDRTRLVQVLVNLLGNAIKFTPQGSVLLRLTGQGDVVRFEVSDTGIGIAENRQAQLFRRFVQADGSIQQRYGGNGLGLAISRRLVELMGGTLNVQSALGEGSCFFFDLHLPPQTAPTTTEDSLQAPLNTTERAWCFLVVDDHPVNRLLVQRVLTSTWPCAQVLEAADGQEALVVVQAAPVDAVLMDMRMPVMDGIEATKAIRRLPGRESRVVIIGLTANVNQDDLARFQAAGLDALMLKPFNWRKLCSEMDGLLLQIDMIRS